MVGALALIALPALAQTDANANTGATQLDTTTGTTTDTTTTTTTGTTYDNGNTTGTTTGTPTDTTTPTSGTGYSSGQTRSVNGVPVQEERTNPAVPTHTQDSGLTASGSVVSWNDQEIVLRTSTGLTHFKLVPETVGANNTFQEGQNLSIDFTRNEQGVLIAKQVRMDMAAAPPQGITTTGATAAGEAVGATVDQATTPNDSTTTTGTTTGTPSEMNASTTSSTTTGTTTGTSMPATASESPLVALLGLMALGAAAGLRRL